MVIIKEAIKSVIERLALEERSLYLEEHPETKGNGFYPRCLFTKYGPIEGLAVLELGMETLGLRFYLL